MEGTAGCPKTLCPSCTGSTINQANNMDSIVALEFFYCFKDLIELLTHNKIVLSYFQINKNAKTTQEATVVGVVLSAGVLLFSIIVYGCLTSNVSQLQYLSIKLVAFRLVSF